jgi:nucleotide-binding universal stress UspA family protein
LKLGIEWARRYDALLVGIAIIDEPGIHGTEEWVLGETRHLQRINRRFLKDLTRKIEQILGSAALRCAQEGAAFKPLEGVGDPYIEILRESQRYDLIMLGPTTHFEFGFDRIEDPTLARVLRNSARPVVVVPESFGEGQAVVIGYDGSLQASRALRDFEASGLGRGREIHVVSIAPEHRDAAALADRAIEFLAHHEIKAMPAAMTSTDAPAATLLEKAREFGAGLIVMGVYGQPILREFVVGSCTRTMLKETPVPLLVSH